MSEPNKNAPVEDEHRKAVRDFFGSILGPAFRPIRTEEETAQFLANFERRARVEGALAEHRLICFLCEQARMGGTPCQRVAELERELEGL